MLLAAEELSGDDALRLGLVNRSGYLDQAVSWAEEIANLAPLSISGHKLMLEPLAPGAGGRPAVAAAFSAAWRSADLQEGLAAFREHRQPEFGGH